MKLINFRKLPLTVLLLACNVFLFGQTNFYPEEMIVSASALKVRSAPNTDHSAVLETLTRGALVRVLGVHNGGEIVEVNNEFAPWYQVTTPSNKIGYVFGAYVKGTYGLYYEDEIIEGPLPALNWYGVFQRDSFSDELRKIEVMVKKGHAEIYGTDVNVLKTNQKDTSKFIIGTTETLQPGYAGPLGIMDSPGWFFEGGLNPGSMLPISSGQAPGDTIYGQTYFLAATGCAALKDNFVQISGFKLQILEMFTENALNQDLTHWFEYSPDINPSVQLLWYGDIDHDQLPDAVIHDCPFEMGCRTSLFLSSKAREGEILRKVGEHFWYGD